MALLASALDSKSLFTQLEARWEDEQNGIKAMTSLTRQIPFKVTSIREAYSDATYSDTGKLTSQELTQKAEEFNNFYQQTQKVLLAVKDLGTLLKNARDSTQETLNALPLKHLAFLDSSIPPLYERLEGYLKIFKERREAIKKLDSRMTNETNILKTELNYFLDVVNAKQGIEVGIFGRLRGPSAIEIYNANKEAKETVLQEPEGKKPEEGDSVLVQTGSASPKAAAKASNGEEGIKEHLNTGAPPPVVEKEPKTADKAPEVALHDDEPVLVQTPKPSPPSSHKQRQAAKTSTNTAQTKSGRKKNVKEAPPLVKLDLKTLEPKVENYQSGTQ